MFMRSLIYKWCKGITIQKKHKTKRSQNGGFVAKYTGLGIFLFRLGKILSMLGLLFVPLQREIKKISFNN